jgi:hypothetical protein
MANVFTGGKGSNTASINLAERTRYKNYMDILKKRFSIKDTLYNEIHYGFLNREYQAVQPVLGTDTVSFGAYAPGASGLNFVVDQFNEFRDFYLKFSAETGQHPPSSILALAPGKSFESFDRLYQGHLANLQLQFSTDINALADFSHLSLQRVMLPVEFYQHFSEKILFLGKFEGSHISKSGYAISSSSTVYETGLYVDLAENLPTDLDFEKGVMLEDPGFLCYLTFATKYGFSVDFNAPWRLVLDLNHEKTMSNILNGRPTEDYWNFYYDQYVENTGFSYDYYNIREFYETLYKSYYRMYNRLTDSQTRNLNWQETYTALFNSSIGDVPQGPGQFWMETFVLNRLREVGRIDSYARFEADPEVLDIRDQALNIYGNELRSPTGIIMENQVSTGKVGQPDSGATAYVTTICGEFLKKEMMRKNIES